MIGRETPRENCYHKTSYTDIPGPGGLAWPVCVIEARGSFILHEAVSGTGYTVRDTDTNKVVGTYPTMGRAKEVLKARASGAGDLRVRTKPAKGSGAGLFVEETTADADMSDGDLLKQRYVAWARDTQDASSKAGDVSAFMRTALAKLLEMCCEDIADEAEGFFAEVLDEDAEGCVEDVLDGARELLGKVATLRMPTLPTSKRSDLARMFRTLETTLESYKPKTTKPFELYGIVLREAAAIMVGLGAIDAHLTRARGEWHPYLASLLLADAS